MYRCELLKIYCLQHSWKSQGRAFYSIYNYSVPSNTSFVPCLHLIHEHDKHHGRTSLRGFSTLSNDLGHDNLSKAEKKKARKELRQKEMLERRKLKAEKQKAHTNIAYDGNTRRGEKKDVSLPLPFVYSPQYVEAAWYDWWCESGFFKPEFSQGNERFVMVLPPPNVTGTLHLGHALGNSIQDALCRWHRMNGKNVLWNPGSDHAGIATQVVVEKHLQKEYGTTRHSLGREKFVERVWDWKTEKGNIIYSQMKKLGLSVDWSRECFTMDPKLCKAVTEAFVRLHEDGLIYRSNRVVNWSCALNSTVSDIEVDMLALDGLTSVPIPSQKKKVDFGLMYRIDYSVAGSDDYLPIATTRPETMLGDTAVAIHPDDERYSHLRDRFVTHPFTSQQIPIICDSSIDKEMGTGAVKITPAHDYNDFEMGTRHNLEFKTVIDDSGLMTNVPTEFQGIDRFEARQKVLKALEVLNLYKGKSEHAMTIPICSRSGDVIEPRIKEQWYVDCSEMAKKAAQAVREGRLKLVPDTYTKQWFDWLESPNTSSWCISRQLWWGHRIPAYRVIWPHDKGAGDTWIVARTEDEAREKAASQFRTPKSEIKLLQDEDVLDTWFSSGIFPFSIFGWPEQTLDMSSHYPTDLLETASDILFFWVARMVMLGEKLTGQLPFNKVLLHSILRDSHGRKMSKSLGNIVDPLDVITGITIEELNNKLEQSNLTKAEVKKAQAGQKKDFPLGIPECGTDALRFTVCGYHYNAHFTNVDVTHIHSNRNFCNKIWQAFKFCSTHWPDGFIPLTKEDLTRRAKPTDLWMLSRLSTMVQQCNESFESLELYKGTKALHTYWWGDFCDIYLEYTKPKLVQIDDNQKAVIRSILRMCVDVGLRCISPFMPFLSEELYQRLPGAVNKQIPSVCCAQYPTSSQYSFTNHEVERDMELVKLIASEMRTVRKSLGLTKSKVPLHLVSDLTSTNVTLEKHIDAVTTLTRSSFVCVTSPESSPRERIEVRLTSDLVGHILVQDIPHSEKAISSLEESIEKLGTNIERQEKKVSDIVGSEDVWRLENQLNDLKCERETLENIYNQLKKF